MPVTKHVMLIIETSKVYGRSLLKGIGQHAMLHGAWSLFVEERGLMDSPPKWLARWRGDGIIFRSTTQSQVDAVLATGLPAVDTNSRVTGHGLPLVYVDEVGVAQAAVTHFQERNFQNFAFCALEELNWVRWRRQACLECLTSRGFSAQDFSLPERLSWDRQREQLLRWVVSLPKPVAVLAANDVCGMRLIDACRSAEIQVPEDVAVLGVDNDEVMCLLTSPPLASIDLNVQRIGREAALVLDRLMSGEPQSADPVWIKPLGVVPRQSTDVVALDDPDMVKAISFIRKNACREINVENVLAEVAISRATLERKFARLIGRLPKEEILRIRLDRVKRLLAQTDLTLPHIAKQTGFKTHSHMSVAFKRETGQTVGEYRQSHRMGGIACILPACPARNCRRT